MSWVQWMGEQWPATPHTAELRLHLWEPHAMCPRAAWSLLITHMESEETGGTRHPLRWLNAEISELHFRQPDWRRLAGLEIRADAAWHAQHEHHHEYGRPVEAHVSALHTLARNTRYNPAPHGSHEHWQGCDWILRLGQRDGFAFSCELDAWLLPEKEFWRTTPEPPAELARFAEGPPQLRVLTRAVFTGGSVNVPRSTDPIPLARRYLREAVALDEIHDPKIQWALRRRLTGTENEQLPGYTSTVEFKTQPEA